MTMTACLDDRSRMIAVDTSALIAILLKEPQAKACIARLASEAEVIMSAATIAETLIVAGRRAITAEAAQLIDDLGIEAVSVTAVSARRSAEAYARWGKGVHPASLNFGDCFAYEVAKQRSCPLLFVGNDFAQTDIESALQA